MGRIIINFPPYWCLSNTIYVTFSLLWPNIQVKRLKSKKDTLSPTIFEVSIHGFMCLHIKIISFYSYSVWNIIDDPYEKVCLTSLFFLIVIIYFPNSGHWFPPLEFVIFNLLPVPEANYQYSVVVLTLDIQNHVYRECTSRTQFHLDCQLKDCLEKDSHTLHWN